MEEWSKEDGEGEMEGGENGVERDLSVPLGLGAVDGAALRVGRVAKCESRTSGVVGEFAAVPVRLVETEARAAAAATAKSPCPALVKLSRSVSSELKE